MVGVEVLLSLAVHGNVGVEGYTDGVNSVVLRDIQLAIGVVQVFGGLPAGSIVDITIGGVDIGLQALDQVGEGLGVAQADSLAAAQSAEVRALPVVQDSLGQLGSSLRSIDRDCFVGGHVNRITIIIHNRITLLVILLGQIGHGGIHLLFDDLVDGHLVVGSIVGVNHDTVFLAVSPEIFPAGRDLSSGIRTEGFLGEGDRIFSDRISVLSHELFRL